MILDCHIHLGKPTDTKEDFTREIASVGVDGGIIFSNAPKSFGNAKPDKDDAKNRLARVMDFTAGNENLFPFFFIDPLEGGALEQVDMAIEAGILGFKVICCHHYPQDDRAMKVWEYIAKRGKPILFHSGILYNEGPSAEYNRPGNFEHLFPIGGLKFALAHISWPWVDELVAVFGKSNYLHFEACKEGFAEMYIDLTPGTPRFYRERALRTLLEVGYVSMNDHVMFGTDGGSSYNCERNGGYIEHDNEIYDKIGISQEVRDKIYYKNLLNFIGK